MSLSTLFNPGSTYYAAGYKCMECAHKTIIFIPTNLTLFNLYEIDKRCYHCEEKKDFLSGGDTIFRYDWPDPDFDQWQIQCAFMLDKDIYCTDCRDEVPIKADWRKLVVACSKCDGHMIISSDNNDEKVDLS